jgi:predicted RNA-binding protein YlxR (DUF448 family)
MGCRKRRDKRELIRMTRNEAGALIRCETGELRGRGFYVCPDAKCLTMTQKKQGRKTPSSIVK